MAFTGAVVAGIGTGVAAYQGEQQKKAAKRSLTAQQKAQEEATAAALRQERRNSMDEAKANQRTPDSRAILEGFSSRLSTGGQQNMVTGPGGVDMAKLRLGRPTLLGE